MLVRGQMWFTTDVDNKIELSLKTTLGFSSWLKYSRHPIMYVLSKIQMGQLT